LARNYGNASKILRGSVNGLPPAGSHSIKNKSIMEKNIKHKITFDTGELNSFNSVNMP